jgi:hypothetical protein
MFFCFLSGSALAIEAKEIQAAVVSRKRSEKGMNVSIVDIANHYQLQLIKNARNHVKQKKLSEVLIRRVFA